ncbi:MAG: LacI family DNA-binding transcriptional regulator [Deltaproteobacteria bacterium]|nr:LacI family DNA-binding transcriptional regulator [Deltaproteobacteria bacterium]MBN2672499.1 LacI family DNA-binding transcriptional regulator [Deltaproteobacteria bacterium]
MMAKIKKTTIKDVAKEAGVSIATVSFVLNNRPGQVISEPVKKKVLKAAQKLNYHPSAIAAGLASKRPGNIAFVFYKSDEMISNLYYSFVLEGAIREATKHSFNIMFSYMEDDWETNGDLPKVVREGSTAGVVFIKEIHPDMVRLIEQRGVPVVLVDHYPQMEDVSAIEIDNFRGGELAAEHLIELGHTDIVYFYANADRPSIRGRLDGYRAALEKAGIAFDAKKHLKECEEFTFHSACDLAMETLKKKKRPTAIICANDELAGGVLRAAQRLNVRVPDELSVVGFDNITMSNYTEPPLTTIGGDKEGLGAQAVRRLVNAVKDKADEEKLQILPVELYKRDSTGPAPKKM